MAPKTAEPSFNIRLAAVLETKHPRWKGRIGAEQSDVFKERSGLKPDIVVRHPGGVPVILETEYSPANTVEDDAKERLGKSLAETGEQIEQVIAVQISAELKQAPQAELDRHIESAEFRYCIHSLAGRWPATGWLSGSAGDLARCIENVSLSERLLAEGAKILENSIGEAAVQLRDGAGARALDKMAQSLHQADGEQTSRMAMAIVANALVFHTTIAKAHDIETVDELRSPATNDVNKGLILACWRAILRINYYPIFHIASELLRPIPNGTANAVLNILADAAGQLAGLGATTMHDLSGRMFQQLITDRKFLATFYTLPTSAALLAELAVSRFDIDWSDRDTITSLQIADLACGTGALLSAVYRALIARYRQTGNDDEELHSDMMERVFVGSDIMPAAMHLTASMLSSVHPGTTYINSRIHTLPYGEQEKENIIALGALDLIVDGYTGSLFGTGIKQAQGKQESEAQTLDLPHRTADLVIMNPPFTRPTNHAKHDVPVPSFAGLGTSKDEQAAMSKRLAEIRRKIPNPVGHGNAGLASNFIDLANVKLRQGGALALVLPASCVSGGSWGDVRRLLQRDYKDLTVLTIAGYGHTEQAFSADTGMGEAIVLGTKCAAGKGNDETLFVNLYHRPRTPTEAFEMARTIGRLKDRQGWLRIGDTEISGTYIRAPLGQGGCAFLRETTLADTAMGLQDGILRLPRGYTETLATTPLGEVGRRGLVHRDISGNAPDGTPRGPFDIIPIQGVPEYPALWAHDSERERRLIVHPDSEGSVRPGCKEQAVKVWNATTSRLHFTLGFRLNSQSLAACLTPDKTIGGSAWPNVILDQDDWTIPVILWTNTTLGLLSFWWIGSRQQQGRAILTITQLPDLTVLDPRSLSPEQIVQADDIFEWFRDRAFLPANEAYRDDTRKALDRAVLVDLLHLPETVLDHLDILRNQWCNEPSVHGGKRTRINLLTDKSMVHLKAAGLRSVPD